MYGGADLSTMDPNPSMDDYSQTQSGLDVSSLLNTAGQWGSTIASIVTGNAVAVAPNGQGGYVAVGAAGSQVVNNNNTKLLLLGVAVVVVVLLVRK